jgi:ATP-dependent Clp protease ATP-binding subunit ClpX
MTTLAPLTVPDLRRILTDVRGSLISQYTSLFGYSGVEIRFTTVALNEICKKAAERGGGARGLRGIMVSDFYFFWNRLSVNWVCFVGEPSVRPYV